jgi:cell division protein FtsB
MITENIVIQDLYIFILSLTSGERMKAAGSFGEKSSVGSVDGILTAIAMLALVVAVILLFWVFNKYKNTEHNLNTKLADVTVKNVKLRQENAQFKVTIEQLQEENHNLQEEKTQLYRKHVEYLEKTKNTNEANPAVK